MLPQFNINVCIICQEETNEKTHRASSDAGDQQIKQAFQIAPRALTPVKVRFEAAVDASAGKPVITKAVGWKQLSVPGATIHWCLMNQRENWKGEVS